MDETTDRRAARELDDRPADQLDDEDDRVELRDRYETLLQELRVLLPGVQVLVAFLLTVPFSDHFNELDELGQRLYGMALCSGMASVVALVGPTVFHRVALRRSRSARLAWGIRYLRVGLVFLAVALTSALVLVARLVFGSVAALVTALVFATVLAGAWVVLPTWAGRHQQR